MTQWYDTKFRHEEHLLLCPGTFNESEIEYNMIQVLPARLSRIGI